MNFLHLLQNYRIKILKTLGRYNYIACFIYSTKFHVNLLYIKKNWRKFRDLFIINKGWGDVADGH